MTVEAGAAQGTIYGSQGGVYRVRLDSQEELDASLRGRLKQQARTGDRVVIGDRVEVVSAQDGSVTIERVFPRLSQIVRRGLGGRRPKVVAANLDRLVVVVAVTRPTPAEALIDRLLVIGEANYLKPILILNKVDLLEEGGVPGLGPGEPNLGELAGVYRRVGYTVLETSIVTGVGLDALSELLCSGTSALVGPSGVGKSSLLNAIQPRLGLMVGELSHRKGQGKHTTVSARLIPLECGGVVADTPGFSDVGVWGVDARELEQCFPEFDGPRDECRFRACTHLHEPGCGVQNALSQGSIDPRRFESYRVLVEEAERIRKQAPEGA